MTRVQFTINKTVDDVRFTLHARCKLTSRNSVIRRVLDWGELYFFFKTLFKEILENDEAMASAEVWHVTLRAFSNPR